MAPTTSPRLPGVPILRPDATGAEYSRWRRAFKYACEKKGTWKYCNGKCLMPMPQAGANRKSRDTSPEALQPTLLDERRAWVRQDREVKLDIFLSLADDVMLEVFEVGPPLPPTSLSAKDMLDALNEHFTDFKFEAYHHAFCHFLNLHIDQYATVEEFNKEFSATLEDLLDYGHPLSNTQACSAYFSKLRCSQNPWVAKKLSEWDALPSEPDIFDLMKESPPWSYIRPLMTKPSQNFHVDSIPEESLDDSSEQSDSDAASEHSIASTVSSSIPSRQSSSATARSQEITVHASSEDLLSACSPTYRRDLERLPVGSIPERFSSKDRVPGTSLSDEAPEVRVPVSEWVDMKKSTTRVPVPSQLDRPLPPLPPQSPPSFDTSKRSKSPPSHIVDAMSKNSSQISLAVPPSNHIATRPTLKLETTHPTLRPRTPTPTPPQAEHPALRANVARRVSEEKIPVNVHPAMRSRTPTPELSGEPIQKAPASTVAPISIARSTRPPLKVPDYGASLPNLAVPWPMSPDVAERPGSSRAELPCNQKVPEATEAPQEVSQEKEERLQVSRPPVLHRATSSSSSVITLPLQGTRDSAWDYLYDVRDTPRDLSKNQAPASPPYTPDSDLTALPPLMEARSNSPTFDDMIIPSSRDKVWPRKRSSNMAPPRASSAQSLTRPGAETPVDYSEDPAYRMLGQKARKKKSWNIHVDLTRFSSSKGVKEMI